jgi:hypothetical protein
MASCLRRIDQRSGQGGPGGRQSERCAARKPRRRASLVAAGKGNRAALGALQASAAAWRARVRPIVAAIRTSGVTSPQQIAAELERRAILTPGGGRWRGSTVRAVLEHAG